MHYRTSTIQKTSQYFVNPRLSIDGVVYWTVDRNDTSNHSIMIAVGDQYFLWKRTTLYAQAGFVNNHGAMNTGRSVNGVLFGVAGSTVRVALGIRHTF